MTSILLQTFSLAFHLHWMQMHNCAPQYVAECWIELEHYSSSRWTSIMRRCVLLESYNHDTAANPLHSRGLITVDCVDEHAANGCWMTDKDREWIWSRFMLSSWQSLLLLMLLHPGWVVGWCLTISAKHRSGSHPYVRIRIRHVAGHLAPVDQRRQLTASARWTPIVVILSFYAIRGVAELMLNCWCNWWLRAKNECCVVL